MKIKTPVLAAAVALLCSCSVPSYDARVCEDLAIKIERRDSLTQNDYSRMIEQSESILDYLVERNGTLSELPPDERSQAFRSLLADPEYMERFGYMFTLGSALYQAEADSFLNSDNTRAYERLDQYNDRFSEISDRM